MEEDLASADADKTAMIALHEVCQAERESEARELQEHARLEIIVWCRYGSEGDDFEALDLRST